MLERFVEPSIVRLQVILVGTTSLAVQLNVMLVLVVVLLAGELMAREGAVLSTRRDLISEVLLLSALSLQNMYQVYTPFAMLETVSVTAVLFAVEAFDWLNAELM